jgi:heterodisulfide reductase subunit B
MALFPGCLVLQRMPQYEKAANVVLLQLGIQPENIPGSACCGAPLESFTDDWLYLAAYNLSLAERMEMDILALCGNCANTLARAKVALEDPSLREQINDRLTKIDLHYSGTVAVKHLVTVLDEHLEALKERVRTRLVLKVALTHPCQAFRPHEIFGFDDSLRPQSMREIVELTGAEVMAYEREYDCCGSTLYLADESLALEAGRRKLTSAAAADVLIDACGNCQLLLERLQARLTQGSVAPKLPVLTLPQLLGLAMDVDPSALAIPSRLLRKLREAPT